MAADKFQDQPEKEEEKVVTRVDVAPPTVPSGGGSGYPVDAATGFAVGVDPDEALRASGIQTGTERNAEIERDTKIREIFDPNLPISQQPEVIKLLNQE
jgi:hypothetical protein